MWPLEFLAVEQFGGSGEGALSSAPELPPAPWGPGEGAWESSLLARCWLSHLGRGSDLWASVSLSVIWT